jgi:predicted DNA-binding WGR domain protein
MKAITVAQASAVVETMADEMAVRESRSPAFAKLRRGKPAFPVARRAKSAVVEDAHFRPEFSAEFKVIQSDSNQKKKKYYAILYKVAIRVHPSRGRNLALARSNWGQTGAVGQTTCKLYANALK